MIVSGFIAKQFHHVTMLLLPQWPHRDTARHALTGEAYHVSRNSNAASWHAETTERYVRMVGGL